MSRRDEGVVDVIIAAREAPVGHVRSDTETIVYVDRL